MQQKDSCTLHTSKISGYRYGLIPVFGSIRGNKNGFHNRPPLDLSEMVLNLARLN